MKLTRSLHCVLFILSLSAVSLPGHAAMVGTAQLQSGQAMLDSGSVAAQRGWITEQLIVGGVDAETATQRVASLTDAQIGSLHQRIQEAPAGAGADGLIIVILILVITELMGYTDIIPSWPADTAN